jgi:endoglucanase
MNTGLSPSTTYHYSVESIDPKGASSATANVSASTPAPPVCGAPPATPGGVAAVPMSPSAVSVSWTAVAAPANCLISYSVFRSTTRGFTPASGNQIASGLGTPSYGDNGLSAATTYYYAVQASDAKGTSRVSAQASATTATATPAVACHVAYAVQSQWDTGFQVAITIANSGSTSISNWTLKFAFPGNQQVTSLWNANYTQSGEALTLTNESYNGTIPAGGSYDAVGFTGTYGGVNSAPAAFTLNGTVCH